MSEATSEPEAHVTTVRVRYAETDQAGVAYHANYLHWFEVGRTEMLRDAGLTYARLERERGLRLTVTETGLQYHLPARYDDVLVITSRLTDVKRVRMRISTSIRNQARNELLCTGHVWLACVTAEGRPCPLPEDVRELLAARSEGRRKMEHGGDVPRGRAE